MVWGQYLNDLIPGTDTNYLDTLLIYICTRNNNHSRWSQFESRMITIWIQFESLPQNPNPYLLGWKETERIVLNRCSETLKAFHLRWTLVLCLDFNLWVTRSNTIGSNLLYGYVFLTLKYTVQYSYDDFFFFFFLRKLC